MIAVVIASICLLLAVGLAVLSHQIKSFDWHAEDITDGRFAAGVVAAILAVTGVIILFFSSFTVVPANHVGVVTTWGKWDGTAQSGWTWIKPWSQVDTFPTRNQKSVRDKGDSSHYNCVSVKLKGNASACVDLTVLYTIQESKAEVLWRGWGSFAKLNEDLINRATDDVAGMVYGTYAAESLGGENRSEISSKMNDQLRARLAPHGVELNEVTLGDPHLPQDVQDRTNRVLTQDAENKISEGKQKQAVIDAETQEIQRRSGLDPVIKLCLDTVREVKPQIMPSCGIGASTGQVPVMLGLR